MPEPQQTVADLARAHTPHAISARLSQTKRSNYLRDWVHGGIDGAVTTFAILAGVAGAQMSARVMLIVGLANLVADGFALAAGNYVATRATLDNRARLEAEEDRQIDLVPEGEREEIRQIYSIKGFEGGDLDRVVEVITSDRERWLATMLSEEHGLPARSPNPLLAAGSTYAAFLVCGAFPLLPLMVSDAPDIRGPAIFAVLVFVSIGALKSLWSPRTWWHSALETVIIGTLAAAIAFALGGLLQALVGGSP
jgi:VIT1/CCC1 family predicted Fe2+/Mn2+ transporter